MHLVLKNTDSSKRGFFSTRSDSSVVEKEVKMYCTHILDYECELIIGKSPFLSTTVYSGKFFKTGERVAIKKYDADSLTNDEIRSLQQELCIMNNLKHSNVITALTTFVSGCDIYMILPLLEYRSCSDLITKHFHTGLPEIAIRMFIKDLLIALDFIHEKGIIHRAVKASNILIGLDGRAKLSGFRYAIQRNCNVQKVYDFTIAVMNLNWLSPDILQQNCNGYNETSDIYSVGITVCELANGFVPYLNIKLSAMLMQKLNGNTPFIYDATTISKVQDTPDEDMIKIFNNYFSNRRFNKQLHRFKDLCCTQNQNERPNAKVLLMHNLITKIDKNSKPFHELILPAIPVTAKCFTPQDIKKHELGDSGSENTFKWTF